MVASVCLLSSVSVSHSILGEALELMHEPLQTPAGPTGLLLLGVGLKRALHQARGEHASGEVVTVGPG